MRALQLLFLGLLGLIHVPQVEGSVREIEIAGGPPGTLYSTFSIELAAYLNDRFGEDYSFQTASTVGSVENIERLLLDPDVMIALAQEDVAHYYYTGSSNEFFHLPRTADYRITALGRIFDEQFYFVTRRDIASPREIGALSVGPRKSGTYATYTAYRDQNRPGWREDSSENAIETFIQGHVDGFISVDATPSQNLTELRAEGHEFRLASVRRTDFSLGLDVYRSTAIPESLSPTGEAFETISIPALLLCSRDIPGEIAEAALEPFYDQAVLDKYFPKSANYVRRSIPDGSEPGRDSASRDSRFRNLPVPPSPATVGLTLGAAPYPQLAALVTGVALLWTVLIFLPRWRPASGWIKRRMPWFKPLRQYAYVVIGAACWIPIAAVWIKCLEMRELLSGRIVTASFFADLGFWKTVNWLIVFAASGHPESAFPSSPTSKLLAVSVQFLGIALLGYAGAKLLSTFVSRVLERKQYMSKEVLDKHVVICNWNSSARELIQYLRAADVPKSRRDRCISILTDGECPGLDLDAHEKLGKILGQPWDRQALESCQVEKADSIIILAPDCGGSPEDSDGVVMRTALAIAAYLRDSEFYMKRPRKASVVAQANLLETKECLREIGIAEAIATRDIGMRLLAQTILCPGVTDIYRELLEASANSNEFHWCPIPRSLVGKTATTFREITDHFSETHDSGAPVLALGLRIKRAPKEGGGHPGFTLASNRKLLLNPTPEELTVSGVGEYQEDDEILIVADTVPTTR